MSALHRRAAEPRRAARKANLGTPDEEEIFATFDTRIIRRFLAFLKPAPALLIGAQARGAHLLAEPASAFPG